MPSILQVALDTPLHRLFDYRLPDTLGAVQPGSLIEVPFGRTRQIGVVLGQQADSTVQTDKLRDVIRVLDDRPALSPDILRLAQFCADYYHYPLGAILLATLPPRLKNATPFVAETPWLIVTEAGRTAEPPARAKAQRALLDAVRAAPQSRDALREHKQGRHAAVLVAAGWAEWARLPPPAAEPPPTAVAPPATTEQQAALDALLPALGQFGVHLVHGVTGSGKTEVYLRLIDAILTARRQALVLIPEIALTPQLEQHFRNRFPGRRIVTLHSGLSRNGARGKLARRAGMRRAARHPAVGVRAAAAAGADRGRRGTRRLVQAAGRPALFGARRRDCTRQAGQGAGGARLGHARAGKLCAGPERALPADRTEAARHQPGAAAGDRTGRPETHPGRQRPHPSRACRR